MSCLLYANDEESQEQIDINELYAKEHKRNLKLVSCFNKILNRVHKKIVVTSKNKHNERFVFFTVPEIMLGEPHYDKGHCVAYLISQLNKNDFHAKYLHPNTLFVSWNHFIPHFVRDEIKRKTGVVIDSLGKVVSSPNEPPPVEEEIKEISSSSKSNKDSSKYISTDRYKPTGQFVYNSVLFDKIEKKVRFNE